MVEALLQEVRELRGILVKFNNKKNKKVMKEFFKRLWEKRQNIRHISNIIIRVIDSIDGVKDWERVENPQPNKEIREKNKK